MSFIIKIIGITFIIIYPFFTKIHSQSVQTLYFMNYIPQSNQMNPAFRPNAGIYFGFPGLTSLQFNADWATSINGLMPYDPLYDEVLHPLHPRVDYQTILKAFDAQNTISNENQFYLLSFGFRYKDWYYTFDITEKTSLSFDFPDDFVGLALHGFDLESNFDLSNFGINSMFYSETAFGIQKNLNKKWSIGAKAKLLLGQANLFSNTSKINLKSYIDPVDQNFEVSLQSNTTFNTYLPIMDIKKDDEGNFEGFEVQDNPDFIGLLASPNSLGFAADLGVSFKPNSKMIFSASIIDLGYIKWQKSVYNLDLKGDYTFDGLGEFDVDSIDQQTSGILDSITNEFKVTSRYESYITFLTSKTYISYEYFLTKKLSIGAMNRLLFFNGTIIPELTIASTIRPTKSFSTSFSYSLINNNLSSFGFGMSLRAGPSQFYIISDFIPLYLSKEYIPYKLDQFNFRFGWNMLFRYSEKKKLKDKPLLID